MSMSMTMTELAAKLAELVESSPKVTVLPYEGPIGRDTHYMGRRVERHSHLRWAPIPAPWFEAAERLAGGWQGNAGAERQRQRYRAQEAWWQLRTPKVSNGSPTVWYSAASTEGGRA